MGWIPLFHSLGLVIEWVTTSIYSGGTLLLPSTSSGTILPTTLLADLQVSGATTFSCVPWMLRQFRNLAKNNNTVIDTLKNLKYILVGGAPIDINDVEWFHNEGIRVQHSMGMTEVGTLMVASEDSTHPPDQLIPLIGFQYRLNC